MLYVPVNKFFFSDVGTFAGLNQYLAERFNEDLESAGPCLIYFPDFLSEDMSSVLEMSHCYGYLKETNISVRTHISFDGNEAAVKNTSS